MEINMIINSDFTKKCYNRDNSTLKYIFTSGKTDLNKIQTLWLWKTHEQEQVWCHAWGIHSGSNRASKWIKEE